MRLSLRITLIVWLGSTIQAQTTVTIDGAATGGVFDGIGGVSAGGSSRLLKDYAEPYRSQILDFLFKPNFGASFQHLKVEIGGDENSTAGAEPTHMRSATDQNYTRGYEFWLMQQAKSRRSDIMLDALEWGAPGWIGGGQFYSQDNINYILNFINGAKSTYGLTLDYVGIWNESAYNGAWIKNLKAALQSAGLSTKIVAADETGGNQWNIADGMLADSGLMAAVDVIGVHYPHASSSHNAQVTGKPLWSSEDGPWRGDWAGAQSIAKTLLRDYPGGKLTKTEIWALITSYYDVSTLQDGGIMLAKTPWSGNFTVQPAVWAVAHVTQFARPGWRYIDSASGVLPGVGSYITLKAPNGTDYSTILETAGAYGNQTVTFTLKNGLSTGPLHVWKSNSAAQFLQDADIVPVAGSFSITLAPDSIYSLTTTTGQSKGSAPPPPSTPFPFPYADSFEQYGPGVTPLYFSDFSGAFEAADCGGARGGRCLRQTVTTPPIVWPGAATDQPTTFIGDITWTNYQESVDALFEQAGSTVKLYGRVSRVRQGDAYLYGYQFNIDSTGSWSLRSALDVLASGKVAAPGLNTWHRIKLIMAGAVIQGVIDGTTVASVYDTTFTAGMGGLGTSWANAQFDDFVIDYLPGAVPVSIVPGAITLGASQVQPFTASVAGANNQVSWSVTPNAGTLTSSGLYTAPPFVATTQTVTLKATSTADTTKSGTATVTLLPVSVSLSPATVALSGGQTQQFTATVVGSNNTAVVWDPAPAAGSISAAGLYTAPASIAATQTVTVTASSAADTTKTASAQVTLNPPAPPVITQQPQNATVGVGQTATFKVTAPGSGLTYQWQSMPEGTANFSPIAGAVSNSYSTSGSVMPDNGVQFRSVVSNGLASVASSAATLTVLSAVPFVLSAPASTLRNDFSNFVGMKFTVGANPLSVSTLGRLCIAGNSGTHTVKLVSAANKADIGGGSVSLNMAGCTPGQFEYATLPSAITLSANAAYFLVSLEQYGGDQWYEHGAIAITNIAAVNSSIWFDGVNWNPWDGPNTSYVSPNFLYAVVVTPQDLTITKTHAGSFAPGQTGAIYTITVTNSGGSATAGTVSVSDTVPAGLTATGITGTGWSCTQPAGPCTRSDVLVGGASYPVLTLTVDVASNAAASVTNTATVSGGGETTTGNDTATDPTAIQAIPTVTAFLTGYALNGPPLRNDFGNFVGMKFTVGTNALSVSSLGRLCIAGNSGTHTVKLVNAGNKTDIAGGSVSLNMAGCTPGQFKYATLPSAITLSANTAYFLASLEQYGGDRWYEHGAIANTNVAAVNSSIWFDGVNWNPWDGPNTSYVSPNFLYAVVVTPQDLTITKTHAGSFAPGQTGAIYTITVTNSGGSATAGTVSVSDTVPAGLTATGITGTGWSCTQPAGPCTRSDVLAGGASYPVLTLTVDVAGNAPPSVTNTATVSGGGETNTGNDTATDPTAIQAIPTGTAFLTGYALNGPPLRNDFYNFVGMKFTVGTNALSVSSLGRLCIAGNSGTHTIKLLNAGNKTDVAGGSVILNMAGCTPGQFKYATLPSAITLSANTAYFLASLEQYGGDQWYEHGAIANTNVAAVNSSIWFDGANWNPWDGPNTSYVTPNFLYAVVVTPQDLTITANHAGSFAPGQTGATYMITVTNSGGSATAGTVSVSDTVPADLTATGIAGSGWSCTQPAGPCTRSDVLAGGASYPVLTLTVDVAGNAPPSVTNTATVSGGGEANTGNDTATDPTAIQVGTAFLTGYALNGPPLRNDFGNFVGMKFTVGAKPLSVSLLGRLCITGNSGTHTLKLVNAANKTDVAGGSIALNMAGCTPGQFKYITLPSAITLSANAAYFLVSLEQYGGDQWYEHGAIANTNVAAVNSSIWFDGVNWNTWDGPNTSYVTPNFLYQ